MNDLKSYGLVFLQLLFIFLLLYGQPLLATNLFLLLIEIIGILFGAWAIFTMLQLSKLSGLPKPPPSATLLTSGPYKLVRNPMYTALIVVLGALVVDKFSWLRLLLYLIEVLVLWEKIKLEEKYLGEKFRSYADYKSKTYRLIPYLF